MENKNESLNPDMGLNTYVDEEKKMLKIRGLEPKFRSLT